MNNAQNNSAVIESEPLDIMSLRYLNESAIHAHALDCSKTYRAGRFTRVGEPFLTEIKSDVEVLIRDLRNKYSTLHPAITPNNKSFITGVLLERLERELNSAIGRLIQNKVQRQPSIGKTLMNTR
jgi:hypothetical protein